MSTREARPEQKIDAAVALTMALGRTIGVQADGPDISAFLEDLIFL
jgi:hypothetical protein